MQRSISFLFLFPLILFALPQNPKVEIGSVDFSSSNGRLEIRAGDQAVIHWDDFSIDQNEIAKFIQPTAESIAINRVLSENPSKIFGELNANGKIVLFNPSGIFVGKEGIVNTADLIMTTLDFKDQEVFSGKEIRFLGMDGAIVNEGIIQTSKDLILIGLTIEQKGKCISNNGTVGLASGFEVLLDPRGQEKIQVLWSGEEIIANVGIDQSGEINAQNIELKAEGSIYSLAINDTGIINANSLHEQDGRIFLIADEGNIKTSGQISAKAKDSGGQVRIIGEEVILATGSSIDVSGTEGGLVRVGSLNIEGMEKCTFSVIEEGVTIYGSSLDKGNGGDIGIFGRDAAVCLGSIYAEGGPNGGDGGFVEISSHGMILPQGMVSTLAPNGKTGMLLLDPCQTTITNNVGTDSPGVTFAGGAYSFPATTSSVLDNVLLSNRLNASNVTINASTGGGTAAFGSITISEAITWGMPNSLTLIANDSPSSFIQINERITWRCCVNSCG